MALTKLESSRVLLAGLCLLLVLAGCSGVEGPATEPPNATVADQGGELPNATVAGERAIDAEKDRILDAFAGRDTVSSIDFGILRESEYEVEQRNESGVLLAVEVGYSVTFECGLAADGIGTRTQYFVTAEETRLVRIDQNVTDMSADACPETTTEK